MMRNTTKFYFKACPKCGGDMYLDRDAYGYFRKCLQCSKIVELEFRPLLSDKAAERELAA